MRNTHKEGIRGEKTGWRQDDFKENSIIPKTLHHDCPKPLHASRVCLIFTKWKQLITIVNRLATIRFWRMKVTLCFGNFIADYLQSFRGDSLHPSQLRYDLLQNRSSLYSNTWVGSVDTCRIFILFWFFFLWHLDLKFRGFQVTNKRPACLVDMQLICSWSLCLLCGIFKHFNLYVQLFLAYLVYYFSKKIY